MPVLNVPLAVAMTMFAGRLAGGRAAESACADADDDFSVPSVSMMQRQHSLESGTEFKESAEDTERGGLAREESKASLWGPGGKCTQGLADFQSKLRQAFPDLPIDGAHTGKYEGGSTAKEFAYLAGADVGHGRAVCQTGFNYGTSAYAFLCSTDPSVQVYSWDLGEHPYVGKAAELIQQAFPGRHTLTLGDSTKTLPQAAGVLRQARCALVFVDGGHSTDVARQDLENFRKFAPGAWVLVDDCRYRGAGWPALKDVQLAYQEAVSTGLVSNHEEREFSDVTRAVCAGRYS